MRTYSSGLKIASGVTLAFFLWSFGPLFQVAAYAAEKQKTPQMRNDPSMPPLSKGRLGGVGGSRGVAETSGERFEKALEHIRENIGKAEEKSHKGIEPTDEIHAIRTKKAEIESIDSELKTEFAETEKKLKDANLPSEILDRHHKFVKHYQDNLKELIGNLDQVEKAQTRAEVDRTVKKAKLHLEKTKPPKRHKALDPNKLPHRMVKAKEKAPRLKKEEFERNFPQKKKVNKLASLQENQISHKDTKALRNTSSLRDFVAKDFGRELTRINTNGLKHQASEFKPLLVASNGSLAGLLPSDYQHPLPSGERTEVRGGLNTPHSEFRTPHWNIPQSIGFSDPTRNSQPETQNLIMAQAIIPPTADDLSETPEVQFTTELRQLAADLEFNPTKIFSFVRNYIDFVPTYGSFQTAQQTLLTGKGNAFAQSALLISLLRASGIPAKFEYGTIIIPIDEIKNWTGVTDANAALSILTNGGIPCTGIVVGSQIAYIKLEHIWTRAWVDYIPSRGAVHRQGDTWIPMDPSFKQYVYTSGVDFKAAVPFDTQTYLNEINNTATRNDTEGWVTGVDSALAQSRVDAYIAQINDYINTNYPTAVEDRIVSSRQIAKKEYPFLPLSLPYTVKVKGWESPDLPTALRHTILFSVNKDVTDETVGTALNYSTSLLEIEGKRITLSYSPATDADKSTLRALLPPPHADGTPIQISELPTSLPAYLIAVKPELRISGNIVATGAPVIMGTSEQLTVTLNSPLIGAEMVNKEVVAGEYYAMALDTGALPEDTVEEKVLSHDDLAEQVKAKAVYPTRDQFYGEFLHTLAIGYFDQLNAFDNLYARMMGIVSHRIPSFGFAQAKIQVNYLLDIPKSVHPKGILLDMNHIMKIATSKDGDQQKVKDYQFVSGLYSSGLEHTVLEQIFSSVDMPAEGISTVKILSAANSQNIPIYTITAANIGTALPKLQTGINEVIQNAINAGKEVITPERNVTINGWTGTGYVVHDPATGGGAYMISGGVNGAYIAAVGALQVACGEIIYDDDPWTGMEIMQAGINQIILADHLAELVFKESAKIIADLSMTFMPWGKVFQGVGLAFGCITSNIVKNSIAGRAFENIALQTLKLTKNTTTYPTSRGGTIPDSVILDAIKNPLALWEVKSSMYICNTGNLPKLLELAKTRGIPLNLVVKKGAELSGPLQNALKGLSGYKIITI